MKLVRFHRNSKISLGVLTNNASSVVDLSNVAPAGDSMSAALAAGSAFLGDAQRLMREGEQISLSAVDLLQPVHDPDKILCIGQNYRDHCEEQNQPLPTSPILFAKYSNTITAPNGVIKLPGISEQIDYEAEMAVVIGKTAKNLDVQHALAAVAGCMCANDVTARDIQKGDKQWVRGKSVDTFFPIGPWLVTQDEVGDMHDLDIWCKVNGVVMQMSNTKNLVFNVAQIIAHLSQTITLQPGDIISTGTPGGVGVYRTPPVFLKSGDTVEVGIEKLGVLENHVE